MDIVVNQCVGKSNEGDIDISEALQNYCNQRKSGQQLWLTGLKEADELHHMMKEQGIDANNMENAKQL
eukprot:15360902-Ditylum_brightwellii.AAC.1